MGNNKARSFGNSRARTKHSSLATVFQRPDRVTQPLDVCVTVFNSARYRSRWKHYEDFATVCEAAGSAVRLWTVEIAFGDREFAITSPLNERNLQLRTTSEIWHKERSLNLLVRRVLARHPHAEYFAFVDADVSFARHDWADETRQQLQHFDVVQMWEQAYDLDQRGNVIQAHRSFGSCYVQTPELVPTELSAITDYYSANALNYYQPRRDGIVYWHPGYAWGWRRSALDATGGLIDFAVLGSADFHMAHALVQNIDATLRRGLHTNYKREMRNWQGRAKALHSNIGCVPGSLLHHWHGSKKDRRYKTRWKILEETQFDQTRDLSVDTQGLYRLQHHGSKRSTQLRDLTRRYFHERNEDA